MNRSALLPAVYLVDQIAGDPEWFPHPVRLIGLAISKGEIVLRRPNQTDASELASGTALTLAIVGATYWLTAEMIRQTSRRSSLLGDATELFLGWTCLAARNLEEEAAAVLEALEGDDLTLARRQLARIVGRDTGQLDAQEMSRAVIETVAESASDGILSPLFFMALGGVPLAMAYKAANTLDSMIGHADTKYFYFGKAAARLDDVANFLPSRLTALAIVTASFFVSPSDPQAAWRTWRRDGTKHKSPNAGQPESAMAGALHVRLGGDNTYNGELIPAQPMGAEFPSAVPAKAAQAIRVLSMASLFGVALGVLITSLVQTRKRG
ncbi:adenosylcobinamide-phosphate synthase CbiB [Granulicella sp. dw_53]|uniref:adenosylcobinamide-phosphate synthase CbiB n=1 Tax=Granulicella sp. dw_53 TaxID=2719792 RepID=UPI001BD3C502|nr:adenosylcobinamide-phosphate synthase CbiB [Granulicella sp. dw_53]